MRREQLCECSRLDRSTFLSKSPLQTGEVDRQQEENKRKQCVFPVKAVQTIRPGIHLHTTLQLELRNHGVERSRQA